MATDANGMVDLDANQVIKREHDEASGAKKVKVVSTDMEIELSAADGDSVQTQSASSDYFTWASSDASQDDERSIEMFIWKGIFLSVEWSGLTGTLDAVLKAQVSANGSQWADLTGETVTLSSASGSHYFSLDNVMARRIRFIYTANGVSGGTFDAFYNTKG